VTTGRIQGTVRIVGAGLIGTSIGLAISKLGADVVLEDVSPANVRLAADYGAGKPAADSDQPILIVVCVPPDVTARVVAAELKAFPEAVVTDVASVKSAILDELAATAADLTRYVGSHPMAGREKGGASSGRADIFVGRPWVIAEHTQASSSSIKLVEELALDLQSTPVRMTALEHDRAVALVSHVPQLVSSIMATRLIGASGVELAGQGLRDTVRIAASDPKLWVQILGANAGEVVSILDEYAGDLAKVIEALRDIQKSGSLATLDQTISNGNRGVEQIPGKHGSRNSQFSSFVVMIDDQPGALARLLTEIGEIGINVEDLKLEHSPGAPIGLVEVQVLPSMGDKLTRDLTERGWRFA
jgi:prephenate dehydrogenase